MPGVADHLNLGMPADRAAAVCVLLHGRGQSPQVMVDAVVQHLEAPGVAWVLPHAAGDTWYQARAVDPLTPQTRAELAQSLTDLGALLAGLPPGAPVLLAGFSQGACLALEHAFVGGRADAVVALTGCRVGAEGDSRPAVLTPGLPVYLSAGQDDPWIPLSAFAQAVVALGQGGARLRADVVPGRAHEVSRAEVTMLGGVLADLAAGRAPGMGTAR